MKIIIIIISIFITSSIFATELLPRPLPQFIQSFSDEDYVIWAQWQNRQTARRLAEIDPYSLVPEYNYADRVTSRSSNWSNTNIAQNSQTYRDTFTRRNDNRNIMATIDTRNVIGTTITAYRVQFHNPNYTGPGTFRSYNPWTRVSGGEGHPDWGILFIPCKEGTITLQELLDSLIGPHNPEKVFTEVMKGYFSE